MEKQIIKIFLWPDRFLARVFILGIRFYQKTLSPDHSALGKSQPFSGCRFYPSCSEYGILVLKKDGFLWGTVKIIWRVLRCNPWNQGGVDFPGEKSKKGVVGKKNKK